MNASEAIGAILSAQGRTKRSLAQKLGISPQALNNRLTRDMKVGTLEEMLRPLHYKIVLLPQEEAIGGYELKN